MPSPFPGMNPYLEQNYDWNEFHQNYISRMQEFLAHRVGPKYFVKSEVRLYLHERSAEERRFFAVADAGISSPRQSVVSQSSATMPTAPLQLQLPAVEIEKQSYLEIRDARNRALVTVIEMLSPSNKDPSGDYEPYMSKRRQILNSPAHFVEIDLCRGGRRPESPALPTCDYYVLVSRREDRPSVGVWPIGLREALPPVPIPLSAPDPPVLLDLKAILDVVYDAFEYGNHIYQEMPDPALSSDDEAWARRIAGMQGS